MRIRLLTSIVALSFVVAGSGLASANDLPVCLDARQGVATFSEITFKNRNNRRRTSTQNFGDKNGTRWNASLPDSEKGRLHQRSVGSS